MEKQNKTDAPGPVSIVLFYDPATGDVVHGHYHQEEAGSPAIAKEALETLALDHARTFAAPRKGFEVAKLRLLHADPKTFRLEAKYKVDLKTQKLAVVRATR
jgi:hypothetical protein